MPTIIKFKPIYQDSFDLEHASASVVVIPKATYSGDWAGAYNLTHQRSGFFVADSSKQGPEAAQQVAAITASLELQLNEGINPTTTFQNIAKEFEDVNEGFATLLYVELQRQGNYRAMSYVSAGHHPPIHLPKKSKGSRRVPRQVPCLPIGVSDLVKGKRFFDGSLNTTRSYTQKHTRVKEGDIIALYSDGITESRDAHKQELEEQGLKNLLEHIVYSRRIHEPEQIIEEAFSRMSSRYFHDDRTLLILKVK